MAKLTACVLVFSIATVRQQPFDWEADIRGTYGHGDSWRGRHRDSRGRYSRTGGAEHLREQLNDRMREAGGERVKEALRRAMSLMEG